MNTQQEIRTFIEQLLQQKGDLAPIGDADSLMLSGRLESIDVLEVVMFLERRFGVDFAQTGFDQAQLDSILLIDELVRSYASST
jgi:acyl carrier protein